MLPARPHPPPTHSPPPRRTPVPAVPIPPLSHRTSLARRSQNAEKQYAVLAGVALRNGMATVNPDFDPEKPYDQPIFWTEDGLARLVSMDEHDVRSDQTKNGKSAAQRTVTTQEAGSRRGHKKGTQGSGKGKHAANKSSNKGGFIKSKAERRQPGKGEIDKGDRLATKSNNKTTYVGGTKGNAESLPPMIITNYPLSQEALKWEPRGTATDSTGQPVNATYAINKSGGMEADEMVTYADKILVPATGVTKRERGILMSDGLGQHHSFKFAKTCVENGLDIALRFPHGSSRGQHEDFEHFAAFEPAFQAALGVKQQALFKACREKAEGEQRTPTPAELQNSTTITEEVMMECARGPWEEAFSKERIAHGWAKEGVVPFTRALMWELKAEEEAKGIIPSNVPPPNLADFGVDPTAAAADPAAASSTAADPAAAAAAAASSSSAAAASTAIIPAPAANDNWDAGIDEEVERQLRAELGDPTANIPPVPPPAKRPKLTSALLFKVAGGATGAAGLALIRAKEVERRLTAARAAKTKETVEAKKAQQRDADWAAAAAALTQLKDASFDINVLKNPQLLSLVRVLDAGKAAGKRSDLIALLTPKILGLTSGQFEAIQTKVNRGVAAAAMPTPAAAPAPAPALAGPPAAAPAPAPAPQQSLAASRPRRGAAV